MVTVDDMIKTIDSHETFISQHFPIVQVKSLFGVRSGTFEGWSTSSCTFLSLFSSADLPEIPRSSDTRHPIETPFWIKYRQWPLWMSHYYSFLGTHRAPICWNWSTIDIRTPKSSDVYDSSQDFDMFFSDYSEYSNTRYLVVMVTDRTFHMKGTANLNFTKHISLI